MKTVIDELREQVDMVRLTTGCGLQQICEGMRSWHTDDPWLAAYYMEAKSHAIIVKGDRDLRDRAHASQRRLIERIE